MWIYAESVGPEAVILRESGGTTGRVMAVVRDGVYLESSAGYVVCLVGVDKEDGPLSVRVQDFGVLRAALDAWEGGEGPAVQFDRDAIVIAGGISVGWKHAVAWKGVLARGVG